MFLYIVLIEVPQFLKLRPSWISGRWLCSEWDPSLLHTTQCILYVYIYFRNEKLCKRDEACFDRES